MSSVSEDARASAYERWELPNIGPKLGEGAKIPTRPLTAAQVELMQTQAYEEAAEDGRKAGYELGYEQGNNIAQTEWQTRIVHFDSVLAHLAAPIAACDDEVEQALLALVVAVAQQLVRRELNTAPEEIIAVVREAICIITVSRHRG